MKLKVYNDCILLQHTLQHVCDLNYKQKHGEDRQQQFLTNTVQLSPMHPAIKNTCMWRKYETISKPPQLISTARAFIISNSAFFI